MSARPEAIEVARQWVNKAENDLKNAEHTLMMEDNCPFDTVCFHAQQCAEKYLKALFTLHSMPFPKTHDLVELVLLLASRKIKLEISLEDLTVINRYAVEARYPGDFEPIDRADAEEALAIARLVRGAVRKNLPKKALG